MSTGDGIRAFCRECVNSNMIKDRENCGGEYVSATNKPCALFKYRVKGKGKLSAIRKNCTECVGGVYWVDDCTTVTCPLYPFRSGKHPSWSHKGGDVNKLRKKRGVGTAKERLERD